MATRNTITMYNITLPEASIERIMQWFPWISSGVSQLDRRLLKKLEREEIVTINRGEIILLYNWYQNIPINYKIPEDYDIIESITEALI